MPIKRPKAPSGCYWIGDTLYGRTRIKSKLIRWSLETDDPKVAAARRKEGKERLVAIKRGDGIKLFDDVIVEWSTEWLEPNKGTKTAKRYLCSIGQLTPYLSGKSLAEIDGKLIAGIIKARRGDKVTNATIKRDMVALSSVFNYSIAQGWADINPVLPRMRLIEERRDPIALPDMHSIDLVVKRSPGMIGDMVRFAMATGAREAELLQAYHKHVDLSRRQMDLIGKRNKRRVIDLAPFNGDKLYMGLQPSPSTPLIFWHSDGQNYKNFASQFAAIVRGAERWAAENNAEFRLFRFHDLRHWHAVHWLKDGRSIYDLQRRLGHTSIKTTEMYCEFLTPEEDRIAKGLGYQK